MTGIALPVLRPRGRGTRPSHCLPVTLTPGAFRVPRLQSPLPASDCTHRLEYSFAKAPTMRLFCLDSELTGSQGISRNSEH